MAITVKLLTTKQVAAIQTKRESKKVLDLKSGKSFNVSWAASATYHSDWTPMTPSDVKIIQSILDPSNKSNWNSTSSWSWNARPGILYLNSNNYIACGFHLRPHAAIMGGAPGAPLTNQSNTLPASGSWALGGHMCMYYGDSVGGTSACNTAAKEAVALGNAYFSNSGNANNVTTQPVAKSNTTLNVPCTIKVNTSKLNYRSGPGTDYSINGSITDYGVYGIIEIADGAGASKWGKLKSGAGWISLDYVYEI